jgi:hypothetical protein
VDTIAVVINMRATTTEAMGKRDSRRDSADPSSVDDTSVPVTNATLTVPVAQLVSQYLEGRVDGLPATGVASFVLGWTSALELVRRTDVTLPDAPDNVREGIAQLCAAIEQATQAVLADPDD